MAQAVNWPDAFVDRLVGGGRQVIRYDHRDTGQSDTVDFGRKSYTVADLAWNGQPRTVKSINSASPGCQPSTTTATYRVEVWICCSVQARGRAARATVE